MIGSPPPLLPLSDPERQFHQSVTDRARELIATQAARFENEGCIARSVFQELAREGYLAVNIGSSYGGQDFDSVRIGLLHQAIGAASTSLRSILTAHGMVSEVLQRWGTAEQRARWLPRLARADSVGALALTEPEAGSDIRALKCRADRTSTGYSLTGCKHWITGGALADLFLVFAQCEGAPTAFLVERGQPGAELRPMGRTLGFKGAMLGYLALEACPVAATGRVGGLGLGVDAIAASALDFGRYTVAWGCVGIGQSCLEASLAHAATRRQRGIALSERQLVRALLTDMWSSVHCAALLCMQAGRLRDAHDPAAMMEVCTAKYVAAQMCARVSRDSVQIHGAAGCAEEHVVARHFRDAKLMEIIEGSSQVLQDLIAQQLQTAFE